jgi:hypothetical protein
VSRRYRIFIILSSIQKHETARYIIQYFYRHYAVDIFIYVRNIFSDHFFFVDLETEREPDLPRFPAFLARPAENKNEIYMPDIQVYHLRGCSDVLLDSAGEGADNCASPSPSLRLLNAAAGEAAEDAGAEAVV